MEATALFDIPNSNQEHVIKMAILRTEISIKSTKDVTYEIPKTQISLKIISCFLQQKKKTLIAGLRKLLVNKNVWYMKSF